MCVPSPTPHSAPPLRSPQRLAAGGHMLLAAACSGISSQVVLDHEARWDWAMRNGTGFVLVVIELDGDVL